MLNEKEFNGKVAKVAEVETETVSKVMNAVKEVVKDELVGGNEVEIHGLVKFHPSIIEAGEREFRNPKTGETGVKFYERKVTVKAKPVKKLFAAINKK